MLGKHHVEAMVVGAGPVGLMSALTLTGKGIATQIIDEEWRTGAHSYALALHPQSLNLLREVGIIGETLEEGRRIDTIALYDARGERARMQMADLPGAYRHILVLRQAALEGLLEQQLAQRRLHVRWSDSLTRLNEEEGNVQVTVDQLGKESRGYAVAGTQWVVEHTRHGQAKFIIGADGHRSTVRKQLDIPFDPMGEVETYAVFEFETPADLGSEVRLVLDENTTSVLWPLPGGFCRWTFQINEQVGEESRQKSRLAVQVGRETYPFLSAEALRSLLAQRAPWFEAPIGEIHWSMAVRFSRSLARSFGKGRCWLAGDAAHTAGPAGVQSMNVGLREAVDLSNRVALILRDGAPMSVLDEYNAARLAEWRRLLGVEGGLRPAPGCIPWVAQNAPRILASIPASGENLALLARQIGLEA